MENNCRRPESHPFLC